MLWQTSQPKFRRLSAHFVSRCLTGVETQGMGGAQTAALLGFHRLKCPKPGLFLGFTSGELPVAPAAGDGSDAFF